MFYDIVNPTEKGYNPFSKVSNLISITSAITTIAD
jgi:hypothetical protein